MGSVCARQPHRSGKQKPWGCEGCVVVRRLRTGRDQEADCVGGLLSPFSSRKVLLGSPPCLAAVLFTTEVMHWPLRFRIQL